MSTLNNARALVKCVKTMANTDDLTKYQARTNVIMALMCAYTESNITNYGNVNVEGSEELPHEAMGEDHTSVGIMQQQVGEDGTGHGFIWGSLGHCQTVPGATWSFIRRARELGLTHQPRNAHALGVACQRIQVSAFPGRYEENYIRASRMATLLFGVTGPTIKNKGSN